MKKKNGKSWLSLVIFSITGQVAWVVENMYFNVFIYRMFNASASDISLMVSASAVAAALTTLFMGALSDKVGKRKVFMTLGYIIWGITIFAFSFIRVDVISRFFPVGAALSIGVTLVIVMDCVMTFFGSTANDAAYNAWVTDLTDDTNRGKAEGINSMMPLIAILVVFGGFMGFDLTLESSWISIFRIIGTAVILIGVLGLFIVEDPKLETDENQNYFRNLFYGFTLKVVKENPYLYLSFIAYAVFGISIQIFMPYLILYYNVSLGLDNYVIIMAPAIILAAVFTFFYGRVYDRKKFEKSINLPLILLSAGYLVLFFFTNTVLVFVGSLLMMMGYLSGMSIFGAVIRDYTPENKAGTFQGLRIFSQVLIPGVIGPAIGAAILKNAEMIVNDDGTSSFIPNSWIFLSAMVVILVLLAYLNMFMFRKKK
ncbi:MAG: MFS transporter [Clostridia bacterium]|nr:MFS transporter [Clostridia bacterium]